MGIEDYVDNKDGTFTFYNKIYKLINCEDIPEGKYIIFDNGYDEYFLISINKPEILRYAFDNYHNEEGFQMRILMIKYDIEIPDCFHEDEINELEKNNSGWGYYFICEINNGYKEFFIEVSINEKIIKKYPFYSSSNIVNLKPYREYIITDFTKSKHKYGFITSKNKSHGYEDEANKYYISKKVIDILEKYFKCKNDKIYCVYNNKKEIAKLTLITEDEILTEDGSTKILQSLKLEIGNKKFTFYINNPKVIDYKKEGKYCFLAMHIYNNSLYNNLIYGYEFKEYEYYYLKHEEKLILKNIDKEISMNFKNMENQNLYTYLLSNNEKCGMIVNIDKDNNITHKLVKLNDKCFESLLDISLLKPVNEWDNKLCIVDEFDSIVEGFDEGFDEEDNKEYYYEDEDYYNDYY